MKIIVTGSSGYIGSHLVSHLKQKYSHFEIMEIDIKNFNAIDLKNEISGTRQRYDAIVHLAASSNVDECNQNPYDAFENNVISTMNIISAIRDGRLKVNFLIFASSAAVYENSFSDRAYSETDKLVSMDSYDASIYGQSKAICERAIRAAHQQFGLKFAILRFSNVAGQIFPNIENHVPETHLIPKLMTENSVTIYGSENQVRDYIAIGDVVNALEKTLLFMPKQSGSHIMNISRGKGHSINHVVNATAEEKKFTHKVLFASPRRGDRMNLVLNNELAKKLLDFEPKISIEEIIRSY